MHILRRLRFLVCVAVGFYGNEKATPVQLPVKTDQDTLREGYRYVLWHYSTIYYWLYILLLHFFGLYHVMRKCPWLLLKLRSSSHALDLVWIFLNRLSFAVHYYSTIWPLRILEKFIFSCGQS